MGGCPREQIIDGDFFVFKALLTSMSEAKLQISHLTEKSTVYIAFFPAKK